MTRAEIESKVLEFVQNELVHTPIAVTSDDDLLSEGLVDSMGMMWLIQHIEDLLQTSIPAPDVTIENFGTAGAIAEYLSRRLNGQVDSNSNKV